MSQIRINLQLSPQYAQKHEEEYQVYQVPSETLAVPTDITPKALSKLVNALLQSETPINFKFHLGLSNSLLLHPLSQEVTKLVNYNPERVLTVYYFPLNEVEEAEQEDVKDWVGSLCCIEGVLCVGMYGGSLRIKNLENDGKSNFGGQYQVHSGALTTISAVKLDDKVFVASGSRDQTLMTHMLGGDGKIMDPCRYLNGHTNSVESVCFNFKSGLLASGDYDGGLSIWAAPTVQPRSVKTDTEEAPKKRLKGRVEDSQSVQSVESPTASLKAHASNLSSLAWDLESTKLITASWDHSLKLWDVERQDCVLSLNGAKVFTAISRCNNSNIVASAHPDCSVRLWDIRASNSDDANISHNTFTNGHKNWVSDVKWSDDNPFTLSSIGYDGTTKIWDIRSSIPIHSIKSQEKGHKGLCLATEKRHLFCGGSDGIVKKYTFKY